MSQIQSFGGSGTGVPVSGPGSSTDNAVARWNGTTGDLLENSVVIISDLGVITGVTGITVTGPTTMNGAQLIKTTAPGAYPYSVLVTDFLVAVDTGAARSIVLPSTATAGQVFVVKDASGGAFANNITVTVDGGVKTIDGAANDIIAGNYDSASYYYDGTNYFTW